MMEYEDLAERILLDLENVFKKHPAINEFDILPVKLPKQNKCPVVYANQKIAIESWCIQHIYLHAYAKFMKWKRHPIKIDSSSLISWTNVILLINPEMDTAWNARKKLIQSSQLAEKEELKFSEVVLSRKPKCLQVFAHRKWILLRIWKSHSSSTALKTLEQELSLCTSAANKYSSNYYAWAHRTWIIQNLVDFCTHIIGDELKCTKQWVSCHVSDYSGLHYRQFLMTCQNTSFCQPNTAKSCPIHTDSSCEADRSNCHAIYSSRELCSFYKQELLFLSKLQVCFQSHEALWSHRRFLIGQLIDLHSVEMDSSSDWSIKTEEQFLNQQTLLAKSDVWELEMITRHKSYLQKWASSTEA